MSFILRLKHWQLFLLTWGLPLLINPIALYDPDLVKTIFPFMILLFTASIFGWIWTIGVKLNGLLPEGVHLNVARFKRVVSIPFIYLITLDIWMGFLFSLSPIDTSTDWWVIILFSSIHFIAIGCTIYGIRFAAKTLKSIELGRMVHFQDYAALFFLIWISILGYWVVQPRFNDIAKGKSS